eukprot:6868024-Karenia_brevis.AAC.1
MSPAAWHKPKLKRKYKHGTRQRGESEEREGEKKGEEEKAIKEKRIIHQPAAWARPAWHAAKTLELE